MVADEEASDATKQWSSPFTHTNVPPSEVHATPRFDGHSRPAPEFRKNVPFTGFSNLRDCVTAATAAAAKLRGVFVCEGILDWDGDINFPAEGGESSAAADADGDDFPIFSAFSTAAGFVPYSA